MDYTQMDDEALAAAADALRAEYEALREQAQAKRAELLALAAEQDRRAALASARQKLSQLTPEERAALGQTPPAQTVGAQGIASEATVGGA